MRVCLSFPIQGFCEAEKRARNKSVLKILLYLVYTFVLLIISLDAIYLILYWVSTGGGINRGFYMTFQIVMVFVGHKLHFLGWRLPKILKDWKAKELVFRQAPYQKPKRNYQIIFGLITMLILVIAFLDQAFFVIWRYDRASINMEKCHVMEEGSILHHMYVRERPQLLLFINIKAWMVPLIEVCYLVSMFYWSMTLNLVIVLAMWLKIRMQQLFQRILRQTETEEGSNWLEIYRHFKQLIRLVADVNRKMGLLIFLTYAYCFSFHLYYLFKLIR